MTVIHKETSPHGDWIIFMNGRALYKKWPTGRSVLFEKFGVPTSNHDRDGGVTLVEEYEPMPVHDIMDTPSQAISKMIAGLSSEIGAGMEISEKAAALLASVHGALEWGASEGLLSPSLANYLEHLNLKGVIDLIDPSEYPTMPFEKRALVRGYLLSLPGFNEPMGHRQLRETFEAHAVVEQQLVRLFGSLQKEHPHLFGTAPPTIPVPAEGKAAALDGFPEDIVETLRTLGGAPTARQAADLVLAERKRWEAEVERMRKAADYISPYLRWSVGDESPGHHPTMPSAVAAFHVAFDIDTPEKRKARMQRATAGQDR